MAVKHLQLDGRMFRLRLQATSTWTMLDFFARYLAFGFLVLSLLLSLFLSLSLPFSTSLVVCISLQETLLQNVQSSNAF